MKIEDKIADLFQAARDGDVEKINKTLSTMSKKAINKGYTDGWTLLMSAAWYGHHDLAEALIKHGAEIHNSLILAAGQGHPLTVKTLIQHGANVNYQDENGRTALMAAGRIHQKPEECREIVESLLDAGADVNAKNAHGGTALMSHVEQAPEVLQAIINKGADLEAADENGLKPIHCAIIARKPENIDCLLKNGADINSRDAKNDATPLMIATGFGLQHIVEFLCDRGADLFAVDHKGQTALNQALKKFPEELLQKNEFLRESLQLIDQAKEIVAKYLQKRMGISTSIPPMRQVSATEQAAKKLVH